MKISFLLFATAIASTQACPYLGYNVGGDSPHDNEVADAAAPCDEETNNGSGSLRKNRGLQPNGRPGRPERPVRPERPGRPDTPDEPEEPEEPDQPEQPEEPNEEPEQPGEPDNGDGGNAGAQELVFATPQLAIAAAKIEIADLVENGAVANDERPAFDEDRLGPLLIRLAFHDCVGGCDGCVNMGDSDNKGLDGVIEFMEHLEIKYGQHLTRPDVWALAALVAADVMQPQSDTPVEFKFEYIGRQVCQQDDPKGGDSRTMPSIHLTTPDLLGYFSTHFGFDDRQTVAIMGAHTLGQLSAGNSGLVDGRWVPNETSLDNQFFGRVIGGNFEEQIGDNSQYLWRFAGGGGGAPPTTRRLQGGPRDFFLNADLALAYDFTDDMDNNGQLTGCSLPGSGGDLPDCERAATFRILRDFARDNGAWLREFGAAFEAMLTNGYSPGQLTQLM